MKRGDVQAAFGLAAPAPPPEDPEAALPRFNVAPTQEVLIIRRAADRSRYASWARWGLLSPNARDAKSGAKRINARSETVFESRAFATAVRNRRCLVPTSGFFEWRKLKRGKQPYHVRMQGGAPYAMAGIWSPWRSPDGREVLTCSVLTCPPNPRVAKLHDRMPVIIPPKAYDLWLDPAIRDRAPLEHLLAPFPPEAMEVVPVARTVNDVRHEGPGCVEPVSEPPEEPDPQLGFGF